MTDLTDLRPPDDIPFACVDAWKRGYAARAETAGLREAAGRVEPLLKARHEQAHNGDIVNLGDFETCDICAPVLAEVRAALAARPEPRAEGADDIRVFELDDATGWRAINETTGVM